MEEMKMVAAIKSIPLVHKILSLAVTILLSVFLAGAYLSGILSLPDSVQALELRVNNNTEAINELVDQNVHERSLMLRMLCNQDPHESWESCEMKYGGMGGAS